MKTHPTKVIPLFWEHDQSKPMGSIYLHGIPEDIDVNQLEITPAYAVGDKLPVSYALSPRRA